MLEERMRNLSRTNIEEAELLKDEEDTHKNADLYTRHGYDEVAGEELIAVSGDELAFIRRGISRY